MSAAMDHMCETVSSRTEMVSFGLSFSAMLWTSSIAVRRPVRILVHHDSSHIHHNDEQRHAPVGLVFLGRTE